MVWITSVWGCFSQKNLQKPIASMFSHNEYLKAERLLSHSGKYWPGRLHPSVQIHHNPIKLADFAIICRFPQSGRSEQIQPVLHKRVVASQSSPKSWKRSGQPGVSCRWANSPKGWASGPKETPK